MPRPAHETDARFWGNLERRVQTEWRLVMAAMLLLTLCIGYFSPQAGLTRLDQVFYDKMLAATTQPAHDEDIVIVAIDDGSINQIGYWPWRRALHAQLIDKLRQARVVGMDFVLSDTNPAYPKDDHTLAQAIARHGRVVLPQVIEPGGRHTLDPLAPLSLAAAALGYINIYPSTDGVIRSLTLFQPLDADGQARHFVAAMLDVANDQASLKRLLEQPAQRLIPYAGTPGHFTIYPYAQVLNGHIPESVFKDKLVLVGSWGSGLGDVFPTPLSQQGEAMAGVEIMANGLHSALHDHWIRTPPRWLGSLLACLPVLLACMALRRLSPRRSFLATLIALLLIFAASWLLMRHAQFWTPVTASIIGVALAYPVWSWRSQEAALQHIDRELLTLNAERQGLHGLAATDEPAHAGGSLSARVTQLHGAIAQLRQAHQKRDETLRFLSHDMRAPQNSILALTQLQQEPGTALPPAEFLQRIDTYAGKTLGLVDGFVQLARAEAAPLSRQRVDLVELLAQCCDEFWVPARQKNIRIRFDQHPDQAWVMGDLALLTRACSNLLDNALKYSADHTEVACRIVEDQGAWSLIIQDQGRGISADQQATLFIPFARIKEDTPQNPTGTGLGLAFVITVINRHRGTITVQSREGAGSTFSIRLPRVP